MPGYAMFYCGVELHNLIIGQFALLCQFFQQGEFLRVVHDSPACNLAPPDFFVRFNHVIYVIWERQGDIRHTKSHIYV